VALRSLSNPLPEYEESLSHFEVLGVPESLRVDPEALREQFYALSKQTHPDRFATAEPRQAMLAARWSTALNRAYQTLRDPILRAEYLLERHLGEQKPSSSVPLELAETYFDLQDALTEPGGDSRLATFRAEMSDQLAALDSAWKELESAWDTGPVEQRKNVLGRVAKHLTLRRFLRSMLADIERKAGTP
jgi:molecular chaperone HscB